MTDESRARPNRSFDWAAAYARLTRAQSLLAAADNPSPEDTARILRERATVLSAPQAPPSDDDFLDLVTFRLGGRVFAVEAAMALEAINIANVTTLPGAPPFYLGLIYHRGAVYPLLDIRIFLGLPATGDGRPGQGLILSRGAAAVAIAASAIEGLRKIGNAAIARAESDTEWHGVVHGITQESIVVLDGDRLLQDARLMIIEHPTIANNRSARENNEPS